MSRKKVFGSIKSSEAEVTAQEEVSVEDSTTEEPTVEAKIPTVSDETFEHHAFSATFDPTVGKYFVVKIGYNLDSGKVGKIELVDAASDKYTANENFKLNVVRSGILGV